MVGADVSADMLAAAAADDLPVGAAPITWVEADAATWDPGTERFDIVISRFGLMFFADPRAAFANLGNAVRPGGRLVAAVWPPRPASALFEVPLAAALAELTAAGIAPEVPPPDEGAFSLGDPAAVGALLRAAGWSDADVAAAHAAPGARRRCAARRRRDHLDAVRAGPPLGGRARRPPP